MSLRRSWRALKKASSFAFFWGGGTLFSSLLLPLVARAGDEADRPRVQRTVRAAFVAFHDYMRVLGLVDYDPRRVRLDLPEGPFVMIANHPTLVDVTAIMAVCGELACVVKEEHWEGPRVGRLLRLCGHINGGDGGPLAGGAVVHQALDRLADGQPVLIFPEGTRSPVRGLGPFYRGAFEVVRRSGAPLVPVLVTCDPPTLMKGEKWWDHPLEPARMDVTSFDAIRPEDLEGGSREVAARVEAAYRARLDEFWGRGAGAPPQDRS